MKFGNAIVSAMLAKRYAARARDAGDVGMADPMTRCATIFETAIQDAN